MVIFVNVRAPYAIQMCARTVKVTGTCISMSLLILTAVWLSAGKNFFFLGGGGWQKTIGNCFKTIGY